MKKKIMIVDDEQDFREMISIMMQKEGYDVVEVGNGIECFDMLKNGHIPDLILLDVMMPGMNGWEVFTKLKKTPSWDKIPIAFLTIKNDNFSKGLGKTLAQDYIEKPFEITDLIERIDKLLKKHFEINETKEKFVGDIINKILKNNM